MQQLSLGQQSHHVRKGFIDMEGQECADFRGEDLILKVLREICILISDGEDNLVIFFFAKGIEEG